MPMAEPTAGLASSGPLAWGAFAFLVITVLALDLGVFHKKFHRMSGREAAAWVSVWVTLALLFGGGVFYFRGTERGVEFLTGYIVELSLSVDNIFVFVFIFAFFGVRPELQHRVLFWGIIGAVVLRMIFIFTAVELLERFEVFIYLFGAFLVYTGVKFILHKQEFDPARNMILRIARRFLPVTPEFRGGRFFVREVPDTAGRGLSPKGASEEPRARWLVTPLFVALLVVEGTDVVFAVDSIPAILGVTRDRFIAYTSNIFAILGLRSMYFLLVTFLDRFHLLRYGLSLVLIFIGLKMVAQTYVHISPLVSLIVVSCLLGGSVVLSLLIPPRKISEPPPPPQPPPSVNVFSIF